MLRLRSHPAYPLMIRMLLAAIAILACLQVVQMRRNMKYGSPGTTDFIAFWSAGQLLRQGENPHDVEQLRRLEAELGRTDPIPLVMVNPTWMLVWLFPLFVLDFHTAALCWLSVNVVIFLASSGLLWVIFNPQQPRRGSAISWMASVAFVPALFTLRMGQTTGLALLGVAGFLFFERRRQDLVAGALLALATVKPHAVYVVWLVLVWWTVVARRWRVVVGCLGMLGVSAATLGSVRPSWVVDYMRAMNDLPLYWATPTIGGVLRSLFGVHMSWLQFVAPALTGLLTLGYLLYSSADIVWEQAIGPVLLLSIVTAAYAWTYDQIVLLAPYLQLVAWLGNKADYSRASRTAIATGLVLYVGILVTQNLLEVSGFHSYWTSWILTATYAYAWLRRRSTSQPCYTGPSPASLG